MKSRRACRTLALSWALAAFGAHGEIRPEEKRSDTVAVSPATRAMQTDDSANPGMLAVLEGEALWSTRPGGVGRACVECHGDARVSMRGVAARYPAWNNERRTPLDLSGQIELCRTDRQGAQALPPDGPERLALSAYVAHQSRGMPISPPADAPMDAARQRGLVLFTARIGQLNLSCATCHDENWGKRLAGAPIPQAHPVGYPIYRLEWQAVGSLQRRFRNCMTGVRAEPYPFDAAAYVDLEAYLMERAAGLNVETPAVRP